MYQEVNRTLYLDCKGIQAWLREMCQVQYFSVSDLTDLLHRLGSPCKLTTALPCEANAVAQTAFLTASASLLMQAEAGEAVVHFVDAAHPTHNKRCSRAWCQIGKERPLLIVSGS